MNDYVFYLIAIVFLFVLWIYSGGPNNPISFSGPYITPVTDVDTNQVGYNDSSLHYYGGGSLLSRGSGNTTSVITSAQSPAQSTVRIVGSNPGSSKPGSEYIGIRSTGPDAITVTGWQLISARTGEQYRIPEGTRKGKSGPVRLYSGDDAIIITSTRGNSELKGSYPNSWNVFLGERRDIWDDDSDTITLVDASGKVVDQYRY